MVTVEKGFSREDGFSGLRKLLPKGVTAIFAFNDLAAMGAIEGSMEAGLEVPRDLAVVGFDDIMLTAYVSPPLTTLRQPTYQKGAIAAEMLLKAIEGEKIEEWNHQSR